MGPQGVRFFWLYAITTSGRLVPSVALSFPLTMLYRLSIMGI